MKNKLTGFDTIIFSHDLTGNHTITNSGDVIDVSDRSYVKDVGEGKVVVMDPVISKVTGKLISVVAAPIFVDNKPAGFVAGGIPLEDVIKITKDAKFGETGYAGLFGTTGIIISHPREDMIGKGTVQDFNVPKLNEIFDRIQNGEYGVELYTLDGQEKLAAFAGTQDKWGIIYGAPAGELYAPVEKLKRILLILSVGFLVVGSLVMYIVAKKITTPIGNLNYAFTVLESGNLSYEIKPAGKDEIAQLGHNYNETIGHLKQLIQGVRDCASHVKSSANSFLENMKSVNYGAHQVSETISQLGSGVETQLNSVEESTKAMSEMTVVIQRVSDNASHVADFSEVGVKQAQEGNEAIKKAMEQMNIINTVVQESADMIKGLGNRSNEISNIVGVITAISEQTNLLALNAAIEAARAGEHGKGFAVVADEVRKLAEQSNQSAGQIVTLIKEIHDETKQAVEAMNHGVLEVKQGFNDVNQANQAFEFILTSSRKVSDEIQEVSVATQQMSASAEQLKIIEHIATETGELNKTADTLEDAINRFQM